MSDVRIIHADSREALKTFADASFDSVVCDPPYALVSIGKRFGADGAVPCKVGATGAYARASAGFMGKRWDTGETAFDPAFWVEVLRVLKPGGHLVAFGGTRTYHRLVCAVEDAGFEIRDQIAWLYGSGFPKSHDVSKGIDKAAGAHRSEVVGSKLGRPGMAKDGSNQSRARLRAMEGRADLHDASADILAPATDAARQWEGWGTALKPALEPIVLARKPLDGTVAANVLKHGAGGLNIDRCRIGVSKRVPGGISKTPNTIYGQFGQQDGTESGHNPGIGRWPANVIHDGSDEVAGAFPQTAPSTIGHPRGAAAGNGWGMTQTGAEYADAGSAARFFYSAKADAADRLGSKHPTVKPVDLMAYLCRLITPPGGTVLDPFAGSGTTGMACLREGFDAVLIEREAEYVADIRRRLKHVEGADAPLFAEPAEPSPFDGEAA